jgi:hypothetical protein
VVDQHALGVRGGAQLLDEPLAQAPEGGHQPRGLEPLGTEALDQEAAGPAAILRRKRARRAMLVLPAAFPCSLSPSGV